MNIEPHLNLAYCQKTDFLRILNEFANRQPFNDPRWVGIHARPNEGTYKFGTGEDGVRFSSVYLCKNGDNGIDPDTLYRVFHHAKAVMDERKGIVTAEQEIGFTNIDALYTSTTVLFRDCAAAVETRRLWKEETGEENLPAVTSRETGQYIRENELGNRLASEIQRLRTKSSFFNSSGPYKAYKMLLHGGVVTLWQNSRPDFHVLTGYNIRTFCNAEEADKAWKMADGSDFPVSAFRQINPGVSQAFLNRLNELEAQIPL